MNQALRKLSGLLVLPVLLAALLILPVRANAEGHECYAELPVRVDLNGENDEQFHVTIETAPEADPSTPLPAEAEDGLWVSGDGDGKFTGFYYTEPGNYEYIVRQECGDTAYMTYDDTVYHVVVHQNNIIRTFIQSEMGSDLLFISRKLKIGKRKTVRTAEHGNPHGSFM